MRVTWKTWKSTVSTAAMMTSAVMKKMMRTTQTGNLQEKGNRKPVASSQRRKPRSQVSVNPLEFDGCFVFMALFAGKDGKPYVEIEYEEEREEEAISASAW
jgi:hypothetical protein